MQALVFQSQEAPTPCGFSTFVILGDSSKLGA